MTRFEMEFGVGDEITIAGVHRRIKNPDRRWWQFWRPRTGASIEYQRFTVTEIA